jgi:excisionase family DNA binding protein
MSQVIETNEVFTLEDTARYLRIPTETVQDLAIRGSLPGRRVQGEWRFLRSAIEDWLRGPDYKRSLLEQAGALQDDESLTAIRDLIYAARGRTETDEAADA